jgi:Na+/proline symporter
MIKDFCQFLVAIAVFFVAMFFVLFATVGYYDGSAKSAYLKQTRNLDIPWYQATFLHVSINSVDAEVSKKK